MTTERELVIGTRGSHLALTQTGMVADALRGKHPGLSVRIEVIRTRGDVQRDRPVASLATPGFFTRELEDALLDSRVDLAVHSLKDLPTEVPEGLALAPVVPERQDPRDCLITANGAQLAELPKGARVATGSLRRRAQLAAVRRDLVFCGLRGNIDTRLRKLQDGEFDAIILARAGLARAGLLTDRMQPLDLETVLPAPGQGGLGLEIRRGDQRTADLLAPLDHAPSRLGVQAERALLERLEAGCSAPVGAWGRIGPDGQLALTARVARPDGSQVVEDALTQSADDPERLGRDLADRLLAAGAADIIAACHED